MKKTVIYLLVAMFAFSSLFATETSRKFKSKRSHGHYGTTIVHSHHLKSVDIDIDDGTIILEGRGGYDGVIEITEDYELFVNGQKIRLNDDQRKLVKDYHDGFMLVIEGAKDIGFAGASIGWEGAKLGFSALGCVFKMLSKDYDEDDLEREMEAKAEKLEAKAELLEEWAEEIEELAEELEDLFYDMEEEIPAVRELEWY